MGPPSLLSVPLRVIFLFFDMRSLICMQVSELVFTLHMHCFESIEITKNIHTDTHASKIKREKKNCMHSFHNEITQIVCIQIGKVFQSY